jgi:hypothetical protein
MEKVEPFDPVSPIKTPGPKYVSNPKRAFLKFNDRKSTQKVQGIVAAVI